MSYCVYKHTTPNGKVYVGITSANPAKRWAGGRGYKNNPHFWNAIIKYGWDNIRHEILFDNLAEAEAREIEKRLIAKHKSNEFDYGYNRSAGGEPFYQCKHTEAARLKMSIAHKGKNTGSENPMYGKGLFGSANGMYGKHHTDEWKQKRSETYSGAGHPRYGTTLSHEEKRKNMLSQPYKKSVLQIDGQENVVNVFESVRDAARHMGVEHSTVARWCTGKIKPTNGYSWRYAGKGGV